ncbi:unnamed protein product, partial [Mesorhabditis spiculigera]
MLSKYWLFTLFVVGASALGCMPQICSKNEENVLRGCPDSDGGCGHYRGERADGEIVTAVDILCGAGAIVHAPFDGMMEFWKPFGN